MMETSASMEGTTFYLKHGSTMVTVDIHNWDSKRSWRSVICAEQQQMNTVCKRPNDREMAVNDVETTNHLHAAQSFLRW